MDSKARSMVNIVGVFFTSVPRPHSQCRDIFLHEAATLEARESSPWQPLGAMSWARRENKILLWGILLLCPGTKVM